MKQNKQNSGFSLAELSVVLLIVGLTVAGVTSGQHLMQAAKLNRIASDITGYSTAANNFKDKYKTFPGDMPNATSFWSTASNGDGNELVSFGSTEYLQFWKHQVLAGTIAGNYTGAVTGSGTNLAAGTNVPAEPSALAGSYFTARSGTLFASTKSYNYVQLDADDSNNGSASGGGWGGALSPADARLIDIKIDDGVASSGKILSTNSYTTQNNVGGVFAAQGCLNQSHALAGGVYVPTHNYTSCRLIVLLNNDSR